MNGKAISNLIAAARDMRALGFDLHQIERIANLLHTEVAYGVTVAAPVLKMTADSTLVADGHLISA